MVLAMDYDKRNVSHDLGIGDDFEAQRRADAALGSVTDAFAEALMSGIDGDAFAHASIHAAVLHLVHEFGEAQVAEVMARLPERILNGEFSLPTRN